MGGIYKLQDSTTEEQVKAKLEDFSRVLRKIISNPPPDVRSLVAFRQTYAELTTKISAYLLDVFVSSKVSAQIHVISPGNRYTTRNDISTFIRLVRTELLKLEEIRDSIGKAPERPAPTEPVLALEVVEGTRDYLENIIEQANGCYVNRYFDAAAVMIRRFVETLIIDVYIAANRESQIKGSDGSFYMLNKLVDEIIADPSLTLTREVPKGLRAIKSLGDRAAHNRYFAAKKSDIDGVTPVLRVIADEFISLAGFRR